MTNHWVHNCRTPKHMVELYQSKKAKVKNIESNNIESNNIFASDDPINLTHLDLEDFFDNPQN